MRAGTRPSGLVILSLAFPSPDLSFLTCKIMRLMVSKCACSYTSCDVTNFPGHAPSSPFFLSFGTCAAKSSSFWPITCYDIKPFLSHHRSQNPMVRTWKDHRAQLVQGSDQTEMKEGGKGSVGPYGWQAPDKGEAHYSAPVTEARMIPHCHVFLSVKRSPKSIFLYKIFYRKYEKKFKVLHVGFFFLF